jgi:predicted nucleic acid-binding protein
MNFLNRKIHSLPLGTLYISVITRMEVLAKPDHTPKSEQEALDFLEKLMVIPLLGAIERTATFIRREGSPRLKLPDAIVAATAIFLDAQLITADEKLLHLDWPSFTAAPPPFEYELPQ